MRFPRCGPFVGLALSMLIMLGGCAKPITPVDLASPPSTTSVSRTPSPPQSDVVGSALIEDDPDVLFDAELAEVGWMEMTVEVQTHQWLDGGARSTVDVVSRLRAEWNLAASPPHFASVIEVRGRQSTDHGDGSEPRIETIEPRVEQEWLTGPEAVDRFGVQVAELESVRPFSIPVPVSELGGQRASYSATLDATTVTNTTEVGSGPAPWPTLAQS